MKTIKFIDLFAGIGGIRIPFDELGYECVFSSEWDEKACETYFANFGEQPSGDITKIDEKEIPPFDICLAGFPCQAFSIMGKMQGFADTRGTMFFEIERILKYHKPAVILLENVKQLTTHDKKRTFNTIIQHLEELGYTLNYKVLNENMNRLRIFIEYNENIENQKAYIEKAVYLALDGMDMAANIEDIRPETKAYAMNDYIKHIETKDALFSDHPSYIGKKNQQITWLGDMVILTENGKVKAYLGDTFYCCKVSEDGKLICSAEDVDRTGTVEQQKDKKSRYLAFRDKFNASFPEAVKLYDEEHKQVDYSDLNL